MPARFTHLKDGPGLALAYGICRNGDWVVGEVPPEGGVHGRGGVARFVNGNWKVSALPALSSVEAVSSPAFGVSSNGHTVVGSSPKGNPALDTAYSWSPTKPNALTPYKLLPGHTLAIAYDCTANGRVAVGYGCATRSDRFGPADEFHQALIWDRPGAWPRRLDVSAAPLKEDVAVRIASSGNIVVGFGMTDFSAALLYDPNRDNRGHEPMYWRKGPGGIYQRHFLPSLGGFRHSGRALGVNEDGDRLVGFVGVRASSIPVWWSLVGGIARIHPLPNLAGFASGRASAISSGGGVIVGNCLRGSDAEFEAHAFIWDPAHKTRKLADVLYAAGAQEVKDWVLYDVAGLSSDGRWMCGNGWNQKTDEFRAWVAYL